MAGLNVVLVVIVIAVGAKGSVGPPLDNPGEKHILAPEFSKMIPTFDAIRKDVVVFNDKHAELTVIRDKKYGVCFLMLLRPRWYSQTAQHTAAVLSVIPMKKPLRTINVPPLVHDLCSSERSYWVDSPPQPDPVPNYAAILEDKYIDAIPEASIPEPRPYPVPNPKDRYPVPKPKEPYPVPNPKEPYPVPKPKPKESYPVPNLKESYPVPKPKNSYPVPNPKESYPVPNPKLPHPAPVPEPKQPYKIPQPKKSHSTPTTKAPIPAPTPKPPSPDLSAYLKPVPALARKPKLPYAVPEPYVAKKDASVPAKIPEPRPAPMSSKPVPKRKARELSKTAFRSRTSEDTKRTVLPTTDYFIYKIGEHTIMIPKRQVVLMVPIQLS